MNIETAHDVLSSQQIDIAIAYGRRWGTAEADLWFDQHENAPELPAWTTKSLTCSPTELCGVELSDEQSAAFELIVDENARDAWNDFERV